VAVVVLLIVSAMPVTAQVQLLQKIQAAGQTEEPSTVTPPVSGNPANAGEGGLAAAERLLVTDLQQIVPLALKVRDSLTNIVSTLPDFPDRAREILIRDGATGGLEWIGWGLLSVAVASGLGGLAYWWFHRTVLSSQSSLRRHAVTRADRIGFLLYRAFLSLVGVAIFVLVAGPLVLALDRGNEAERNSALVVLGGMTLFMLLQVILKAILAPVQSDMRIVAMADYDASNIYRSALAVSAITVVLFSLGMLLETLDFDANAHRLVQMVTSTLIALSLIAMAVIFRRPISTAIAAGGKRPPAWRKILGKTWCIGLIVYLVLGLAVAFLHIVLDIDGGTALVLAPFEVLLTATVAYAFMVVIINRFILPRRNTPQAAMERLETIREARGETTQTDNELDRAQAVAEVLAAEEERLPYRNLLEHGAAILTAIGAIALLLRYWGVPISHTHSWAGTVLETGVVTFLAYLGYQAIKIGINRRIEAEKGENPGGDEDIEVGGMGESRLATLLPIVRHVLLITIVAITFMIVAAELGINIAPIFAGAGVVGLAVGFGAQTLIRDIFSGAFFLVDDAFRKGEYIDIGTVKGTVENISLRSMQLRHHRGILNTVPFGEIQYVQNFSRDWAIMKLSFRLTYDTDVERVRKMIKKLGQQLLEDPNLGPKFLEPLKSQGVLAMEDSAMIVRVKYTTKPGDQYILRKAVYAKIRELFEKEGIRFAHREVKVHVSSTEDQPLSDAEKRAAAGAALAVGNEPAQAGAGAGGNAM
jgi:small-conductance mechanosensitive channel